MNKRYLLGAVVAIIVAVVLNIVFMGGGNARKVDIQPIESDLFTEEDYDEATQVAISYFVGYFDGCTMTELRYAGDDVSAREGSDIMVLLSTFDTDSDAGEGSLEPNTTYSDFQWIMERDATGTWQHKDHGYG